MVQTLLLAVGRKYQQSRIKPDGFHKPRQFLKLHQFLKLQYPRWPQNPDHRSTLVGALFRHLNGNKLKMHKIYSCKKKIV